MDKQQIVNFYLEQGILLSPALIDYLDKPFPISSQFAVLNSDALIITEHKIPISIEDYERAVVLKEKGQNKKLYEKFHEYILNNIKAQRTEDASKESAFSLKSALFETSSARTLSAPAPKSSAPSDILSESSDNVPEHDLSNPSGYSSPSDSTNASSPSDDLNASVPSDNLDVSHSSIIQSSSSLVSTVQESKESFKRAETSIEDIKNHMDALPQEYDKADQIIRADAAHRLARDEQRQEALDYESRIDEEKKAFMKKHRIQIIHDYREKNKKRSVQDFVGFFNSRYKELEKILRTRTELSNLTSISRILAKKEKENVALIGIVYEKQVSKNNNLILTLEDQTGSIKVVVTQSKSDLFEIAQEIQLDETIGITGTYDGIVFANNILLPDVPLTKELKKSPEEGYFAVITDPQVGNKLFLEAEYKKFIAWLSGEVGNEHQRELASKIRYLFIVGDLVEGVGIYPDQEFDLNIIDVRDQYKKFAEYIKDLKIPVIVCPGNHDVGRLSEPQPGFRDEYSKPLWELTNTVCVSNPATINIYASEYFEGFDVLMYHGGSFFYYFNNVPAIRQKGGQTRSDLVMKYLLQRRHLAPSHTSTVYIPDAHKDPLVIDRVPDFFLSGHVHRATVNNYRNITCINASCWNSMSEEQERRGLVPQPAKAFIVNMQTREVKIMNFLKEDEAK